ncbi:MAG TPA: RNA-binding domain-containing protein [Methanothrix sp.]|nr:RNA-binding domain-containing protein [Methanothrix sp.]HPT18617.1 RNA-binding domain-containing protein [Methanothrix sp.]
MRTIEVSICSSVRPTEKVDRVVSAVENIFPGLVMDIRSDKIEAYGGADGLKTLHEMLRRQRILDSARSVMRRGLVGETVSFQISKQAALMGVVSFPPEEEPLGSLHIQITGGEIVIDWLAPKTLEGVPVQEIDLPSGDASSPDSGQGEQKDGPGGD